MQREWKKGMTLTLICLGLLFVGLAMTGVGEGSVPQQFVAGLFVGLSIVCGSVGIYLTAREISIDR